MNSENIYSIYYTIRNFEWSQFDRDYQNIKIFKENMQKSLF